MPPEVRSALRREAIQTALRRRDLDRAIVEAEELLDESPQDLEVLGWLGALFLEHGDLTAALETWRAVVELSDPPDPAALCQLAVCAFTCCQLDEAAEAAREAVALAPSLGEAHHVLGLVVERTSGAAAAWPHFLAAWRAAPLGFPLPVALAEADVRLALDEALASVDKAIRRFWRGIPVVIADYPALGVLTQAAPPLSPRVVALAEGSPGPEGEAPQSLQVFAGNLAHTTHLDDAVEQLIDALTAEAEDWMGGGPPEPD